MNKRTLVGLAVLASVVTLSCTREPVSAPLQKLATKTAAWGEGVPPCDELHPCHPPSVINGRMTGGGGDIAIGDIWVTKGLTLHCDITLSNNLEINWAGGNNWHLDKPITWAYCVDNPNIGPEPPRAPFDTFMGEAYGTLNGVSGSFIRFTFVDAGEPGGNNDMAEIHIFDAGGTEVLTVPLSTTSSGNLQAHEDQPHK